MSDDGRVIDLAGLDLRLERETPVSDNPLDPVGAWRDAGGTAYVVEKKDDEYHVRSASMPADEAVPTLSVGATQSIPFAVLWLVIGATFFTLRMGFISIRGFKHAILVTMGKYDDPEDVGEVSHFQALSAALSATVGLGNIAGVAIAVILGGPGATFWLIVAGFLGMTSKMVECTLGQMYREVRPDGRIMGGAMFYLSKGLQEIGFARLGKFLAITFALLCVGASFGGGNAFQVNQSLNAVAETIPALQDLPNGDPSPHRWIYGAVMTAMGAVVILGGIRRIAKAAEMIVPAMCGIYVLAGLAIIGMNIDHVPGAMREILDGAFRPEGMYGGLIGVLVTGFKRAAFSNEAGVGSAAIAHSAAKTDYPVREGLVALLEPFIDTIVVCSMSALVIVITGAYNNPAFQDAIDAQRGAALMSRAMDSQIPGFRWILSLSVFLFAYSTMISWSYYGERCCAYLFGDRSSLTYRLIFLVFTFLGSITTAQNVLDLSDLMILGMAVPNILGLFLLSGVVKKALDEYWGKYKSGEFKMTK
ncbi:MAG: alanine/glycine:cation symporter family protein [Planctomycetota bacterium]|nr:alanine/glycine:cation symporter family protein [Planctomycetota bacterium]